MKNNKIVQNIRKVLPDTIWTITALMLMNCVLQFVVYPVWAKQFGNEKYGNIVYIMSLVNLFSVSMGSALNYARMTESAIRKTRNGDYNNILCVCTPFVAVLTYVAISLSKLDMTTLEVVLATILSVITMLRYYADVEYRLNLNYRGYFRYYFIISAGYLVGIGLFLMTDIWPLALLPGEIFGLVYVYARGTLFSKDSLKRSSLFRENFGRFMLLVVTNIVSNAIFNGDRILLQMVLGGSAVSLYYLASLIGKTMSLITTPLNSVIIGYLARYKGNIEYKMVHMMLILTIAAIFVATCGTVLGSHIIIRLLYSENYIQAKEYFLIANLAQVVYFAGNVVTTVMLRISKANRQLLVNAIYALSFVFLCIPATVFGGFDAFCFALLIANAVRYLVAIVYCYFGINQR